MTPSERRRRFKAEIRRKAAARGVAVEAGVVEMLGTLAELQAEINRALERLPSEFQAYQLPQLLREVERAIDEWQNRALGVTRRLLEQAWERGPEIVDGPFQMAEIHVGRTFLPRSLLEELSDYAADKIKDIGPIAKGRIENTVRRVVLGGEGPVEAMRAVGSHLGEGPMKYVSFRSETIIRTEVGRVHSQAADRRLRDAAELVTDLGKQWLWSGKSRQQHMAINGQLRAADQDFEMPDGTKMPYPRAAGAPIEHVANCGCESIPYMAGW